MLTKGDMRLVHSRRDSKLMVSSQMLVSNNESIIASYSSDTQYALARDSYGESDDLFLDPGSGAASTSETILYYIGVGYAEGCTSEMGSVSGSGSYEDGATAVIKAVANEGYRFVKWDDDNTSAERSITVAAEHNYLALFEAEPSDTATITVTSNDAQKGSVSIDGGEAGASAALGAEVVVLVIHIVSAVHAAVQHRRPIRAVFVHTRVTRVLYEPTASRV